MLKPWRFHSWKESCRSRITFHGRTACHGFPYWLTSKDVAILSAVRLTLSLDKLCMNYFFYLLEQSSQDALPCFLRLFRKCAFVHWITGAHFFMCYACLFDVHTMSNWLDLNYVPQSANLQLVQAGIVTMDFMFYWRKTLRRRKESVMS